MTNEDIAIVKAIQGGLPISEEPFADIARQAGVSQERLLERLKEWKTDGTVRRVGALLRHTKAGYFVNSMGAWNVPDEQVESFGKMAAEHGKVSHCYQRPRFAGFRFNLYTMIHGKSKEECETVAKEISERTGIADFDLLYTTAEYKKTSPVYFTGIEARK